MIEYKNTIIYSLLVLALTSTNYVFAKGPSWEVYGSLRIAVESVDPDNTTPGKFDNYTSYRDAYTRFGAKAGYTFNDDWSLLAQHEIPWDLANNKQQSPYWSTDNVRIAKIQLTSPYGKLWYGRGWMAYYNYIAYPVDYFSSYYSGWTTLTTFRRQDTFYYSSPTLNGFQVAVASTADNGNNVTDNRNQYVLSYSKGGLSVALAKDDPQKGADYDITGLSASYTTGPWYLATKYEVLNSSAANKNGKTASNILVQYKLDDVNTVRAMLANVQSAPWGGAYGDNIIHLGWDHQYKKDLKFFAEYYSEETTSAISNEKYPTFDFKASELADSGGQVITVGVRYDFSIK